MVISREFTFRWLKPSALAAAVSLTALPDTSLATILLLEPPPQEEAIAQHFLTDGASIVLKGDRHSCRVFQEIDVRASRYIDPNGAPVDFLEVARSPAAGIWRIGAAREAGVTGPVDHVLRIALKYPVETLALDLDGAVLSLTEDLDPAGDSVTLRPEVQARLERAFEAGLGARLVGRSVDTGRRVEDALVPFDARDIDACDRVASGEVTLPRDADTAEPVFTPRSAFLDSPGDDDAPLIDAATLRVLGFAPPTGPMPHNGAIRVFYDARLPGSPTPERLLGCRMTDLGGEVERYRLTRVEGFVSQIGEAWITRDARGEVRQIYIPGVFEALRSPGSETWRASVSIAASANDPFEEPVFKGCLGARSLEMNGAPGDLAEVADAGTAWRSGYPVMRSWGGSMRTSTATPAAWSSLTATFSVGGSSRSATPRGETDLASDILISSVGTEGGSPDGSPQTPDMPTPSTVPLPLSVMLLLSALGALVVMRRRA